MKERIEMWAKTESEMIELLAKQRELADKADRLTLAIEIVFGVFLVTAVTLIAF